MERLVPELKLPKVLDSGAVDGLVSELLALRGGALSIDASAVERLGGLCLQALLSARTTWASDAQPFTLNNPSPAMREALALMGAEHLGTPLS